MSGAITPTVIYSFGDSLSDAGDAYLLSTSSYASELGQTKLPVSPPYYQEVYNTTTADVFSNGPVWVQDLAATLSIATPAPGELGGTVSTLTTVIDTELAAQGVPSFLIPGIANGYISGIASADNVNLTANPNAYLQLVAGASGGTDFAIGGSVTGLTNFNTSNGIQLTDLAAQVTNFQNEVTAPASSALYTVWSGSNDVINLVDASNIATLISSGAAATDVAQSASAEVASVSTLIAGGAKNLLVLNVPDVGKVPSVTALGSTIAADGTLLAQEFNADLVADLAAAQASYGTASVKVVDTFSLIDNAVANPGSYGLTNVTNSAYTGTYTTNNNSEVSNPNSYLFFDGMHPTSTGQNAVANAADAMLSCFAEGTLIRTPDGDMPVEALRAGDSVTLLSGASAIVEWVGHRRIDLRRHPRPLTAMPILITADALADQVPSHDLLVSPDHAMCLDGRLIPAKVLCNGHSIRQVERAEVTYFHIELARHDVLFANNTPAESYLETGQRAAFENGDDAMILHPQFGEAVRSAASCAPLAESGPIVEAVRQRILDRVGLTLTDEAELRVVRCAEGIRIRSRCAIPGEVAADPRDRRTLGVKISAIEVGGVMIPANHELLTEGWHNAEADGRWTDGDALVPNALLGGADTLVTHVVATGRYVVNNQRVDESLFFPRKAMG
jgi:phospholipase/lecithinase/hemolysin